MYNSQIYTHTDSRLKFYRNQKIHSQLDHIQTSVAVPAQLSDVPRKHVRKRQKMSYWGLCAIYLLLSILVGLVKTVGGSDVNVAVIVDDRLSYAQSVFDSSISELQKDTQSSSNIKYNVNYDGKGTCTRGPQMQEGVASLMNYYYKNNIQAVFGPTCYYDLEIAARLTSEWHILQFNFWNDHPSDYINPSIVQMTTRSLINICENILAFLKGVEWNKLVFIYCTDCYQNIEVEEMQMRAKNITHYLDHNDIVISSFIEVYKNYSKDDYKRLLVGMNTYSRVVLPLVGEELADYINLQLALRELTFNSSEYSTLILAENYSNEEFKVPERADSPDLFEKVAVLRNEVFDKHIIDPYLAKNSFPERDALMYIHLKESVNVFNQVVQQAQNTGISVMDALQLAHNYQGPFGEIKFNSNFHRISGFTVYIVEDNLLVRSANQITTRDAGGLPCIPNGQCLTFTPVSKQVFNSGQPTCGFQGELCDQTGTVVIIAAVMATVFVSVGVFVGIRRMKSGETASMPWVVPSQSVKLIEINNGSQHMSILSLQQHLDSTVRFRDFMRGRQLATLEQAYVIVERYPMRERLVFDKNDMYLLFQLKQLSHDNINPFMGMCFDRSIELMLLWTHCFRGSLAEMLFATKEESGISFDNNFRRAFVRDILKGLDYLHSSALGYHGSLSPSQCHIDSHWILKLSGFGMNRMLYKWKNNGIIGTADGKPIIPNSELHYYAPEMRKLLKGIMYTHRDDHMNIPPQQGQAADMYAFGIILYELMFRRKHVEIEDIYQNESNDDDNLILCEHAEAMIPPYPVLPSDVSEVHPDLIGLMHKCWSDQLDIRPDAALARKITDATLKMSGSLVDHLIRNMEMYTSGLQDLVSERTSQSEEAQRKSDELLWEMLPKSLAEDLKNGKKAEAKNYKSVTIMYSDIVGFTSLCSESQPMEVVALLSGMFENFDRIISQFDGYKMETIGDAYCVASGIPTPNRMEHVKNIATIALLQRDYLKTFEIPHRPGQYLHCRWGFNTGPVFTGVVGIRAPRYSVFGQTVTIASKMENLGQPDCIQMTLKSHKLLSSRYPEFKCTARGSTRVPGIGMLLTYWLDGVEELLKSNREEFDKAIEEHESQSTDVKGILKKNPVDSTSHISEFIPT
ncbi:unnamed protein product [Auanema sp. JU1783]|nr:unnamed protein product [Auanema sp. JU1783]